MSNGKIKTPCFIVNVDNVVMHYRNWISAFRVYSRNDLIAYSVKANYDAEILKSLNNEGCMFEVCTRHEYDLLVSKGINPEMIIVNGTICDAADFSIYASNKSLVILDSDRAINIAIDSNVECYIGIRCNLDWVKVDKALYKSCSSRFGINDVLGTLRKLEQAKHLKLVALQAHFSGNTRAPRVYRDIVRGLSDIVVKNNLRGIEFFDIGGGYKIANNYWNEMAYVKEVFQELKTKGLENIHIIYEPGNAIVRDSVSYITKIIDVKRVQNKNYCIVDGSTLHIPYLKRIKLFDYEILGRDYNYKINEQIISGCTCKESDVFVCLEDDFEIVNGNYLIVDNVGAYVINEISPFLLAIPTFYYDVDIRLIKQDISNYL